VSGPDLPLDQSSVARLYEKAAATRWSVAADDFAEALRRSAARAFGGGRPSARELERYLSGLHVADLALACACARGHEAAWDHFMREHRPVLYRAADALEPGGAARELADSLYAELYGLRDSAGERQSLFGYYHGRSSLATWLRAVLAQRHVDAVRTRRRTEPLPEEDLIPAAPFLTPDPDRVRLRDIVLAALHAVVARLPAKDRLRLRSYYAARLTLAQIGRLTGEHEATVSRQLSRTRRAVHEAITQELRARGLEPPEVARGFEILLEDPAGLDVGTLLGADPGRKVPALDRSRYERDV
jgi:RNA polymerase sigma-70 factor (ECF subfamily)